jgi:hypothetical protein
MNTFKKQYSAVYLFLSRADAGDLMNHRSRRLQILRSPFKRR